MNGNSLICWTNALSRYPTRSADDFYQFGVHVLNKINTLKRFEQKYLLLSGFTLEVVQISPANTSHIV